MGVRCAFEHHKRVHCAGDTYCRTWVVDMGVRFVRSGRMMHVGALFAVAFGTGINRSVLVWVPYD